MASFHLLLLVPGKLSKKKKFFFGTSAKQFMELFFNREWSKMNVGEWKFASINDNEA